MIKIRFTGVCIANLICLYILNCYDKYNLNELEFNLFNYDLLINGILKPIFILFIVEFIPILIYVQEIIEGLIEYDENQLNIIKLRNYFLAPLSEELSYRFILLKILQPCFSQFNSCLISSLLFGLSHFHHYVLGRSSDDFIRSFVQFTYSFLFGLFAASMYLRSTYLITAVILHSICNLIGVPNFERIKLSPLLTFLTFITFFSGLGLAIVL